MTIAPLTEAIEEEQTNGLDEFFDWDSIEEALDAGKFTLKSEFKAEVRRQFEEAGVKFTRTLYESVVAGMFPQHRELYHGLSTANRSNKQLNAEVVKDIRCRASRGEKAVHLAVEYGINRRTVSDLINLKTWRNVA